MVNADTLSPHGIFKDFRNRSIQNRHDRVAFVTGKIGAVVSPPVPHGGVLDQVVSGIVPLDLSLLDRKCKDRFLYSHVRADLYRVGRFLRLKSGGGLCGFRLFQGVAGGLLGRRRKLFLLLALLLRSCGLFFIGYSHIGDLTGNPCLGLIGHQLAAHDLLLGCGKKQHIRGYADGYQTETQDHVKSVALRKPQRPLKKVSFLHIVHLRLYYRRKMQALCSHPSSRSCVSG